MAMEAARKEFPCRGAAGAHGPTNQTQECRSEDFDFHGVNPVEVGGAARVDIILMAGAFPHALAIYHPVLRHAGQKQKLSRFDSGSEKAEKAQQANLTCKAEFASKNSEMRILIKVGRPLAAGASGVPDSAATAFVAEFARIRGSVVSRERPEFLRIRLQRNRARSFSGASSQRAASAGC
jgi:hypothetical protein